MDRYVVKVKVNGEPGWSGSPIWIDAIDYKDAEKQAKRIHAQRTGANVGNVDAKAEDWTRKRVWRSNR